MINGKKCGYSRVRTIIALFCCLLFTQTAEAQNVFYGERDPDSPAMAIHFDKNGFPYPDYRISNESMTKAYGSLFTWFQYNNEAFIEICADYNYFPEAIDETSIFTLRDSIIARWAIRINAQSKAYPAVAFYIHGFRKQFVSANGDVTSVAEFALLKENLATYGKPKAFEVEVYWDGLYGCCFSANRKKNKELFGLYETACLYAQRVGPELRRVLSSVKTQQLQIVAHSLGACVAASALFNTDERSSAIPTPSQPVVSVCLLAPAIEGALFERYYDRSSGIDYTTRDNYRLLVVYNEEDFVLLKKDPKTGLFGPGTKKYGNTSLGCNYKGEAVELEAYFRKHYPHSQIGLVNKTSIGKCHSLRCYTQGTQLKEVSDFLWTPAP
jgi:hypothetical protein